MKKTILLTLANMKNELKSMIFKIISFLIKSNILTTLKSVRKYDFIE